MDGKPASEARAISGLGRRRTVTSVTTPSNPSDPVTNPMRSSPPASNRFAAEPNALAPDQRQFDAQEIIRRQPVFETMNSAGVFRDIAADRAGDLARGIGRIIKTPGPRPLL